MALTKIRDAGLPSGTVLQVVYAKSTSTTFTSTSSSYADVVTATITPSSSSSKVLVSASGGQFDTSGSAGGAFALRDNSDTVLDDGYYVRDAGEFSGGQVSINYLDSPSTTSAITYKLSFQRNSGSGTAYITSNNHVHLTLMEIAG
jgi:hypothetical protein